MWYFEGEIIDYWKCEFFGYLLGNSGFEICVVDVVIRLIFIKRRRKDIKKDLINKYLYVYLRMMNVML